MHVNDPEEELLEEELDELDEELVGNVPEEELDEDELLDVSRITPLEDELLEEEELEDGVIIPLELDEELEELLELDDGGEYVPLTHITGSDTVFPKMDSSSFDKLIVHAYVLISLKVSFVQKWLSLLVGVENAKLKYVSALSFFATVRNSFLLGIRQSVFPPSAKEFIV